MIFLWNGVYHTYIDIEPQVLCIFCSLFRTPSSNFALDIDIEHRHRHRTLDIDIESQVPYIFCSLFRTPSSNFALHSHVSTFPVFFTSLKLFVHQVPPKMSLLQEAFLGLSIWLPPQLPSDGDVCHQVLQLHTIRLLDTGIVSTLFTSVSQVLRDTWDKIGDE